MDAIELRVHSFARQIIELKTMHPNFVAKVSNICFKAGVNGADLALQFTVREIQVHDLIRNESTVATVPWAGHQLVTTDPESVNFDDISSSKHTLDDVRSRSSFITNNSKLTSNARPRIDFDL
jgi:hypothetical protein